MITPEQVPDEVVKTLEQALLGRPLSARNCTAAIAAALNAWPGTGHCHRDEQIARLRAEVERLRAHLKTAIWSDSEECKLLTRINAVLLEAPTVDVDVVVPNRDYSAMTPKDCYEAGLLDGVHQAREAIKAATRAALAQEKHDG